MEPTGRQGRSLGAWAAFLLFVVLTAGRLVGSPLVLVLVSGPSMEPTLRPLDLTVCVRVRDGDVGVGDIVVWYASPIVGTIHRVVEVRGDFIVTKGDANPRPDPPVPISWVKYRVIGVIPREAWIPLALGGLALYSWRRRLWRVLVEPLREFDAATLVLASFLLLAVLLEVLVEVPLFYRPPEVAVPHIELTRVTHNIREGTVYFVYSLEGASVTGVEGCTCTPSPRGPPLACRADVIGNTTVRVEVPAALYTMLYRLSNTSTSTFTVNLAVRLDKGIVKGHYDISFRWRRLLIALENATLEIYNPNPIPFNATIDATLINRTFLGSIIVIRKVGPLNVTIQPMSTYKINLYGPGEELYVTVSYDYKFARGERVEFRIHETLS